MRRMDRQGEVLIWCRKCSGYARQRLGPKLMNCCKPEKVGTREYGKMLKRIKVLEEARVWKIEGQKTRITGKGYGRLWDEFEIGGFMAQKELWNIVTENNWKTDKKPYLKKTEINCWNTKLCMKKTFSAVVCERMWKEEKAEMERKNDEAKQKWEKRGVGRAGERVEIKRMCVNMVSSGFFEDPSPMHG